MLIAIKISPNHIVVGTELNNTKHFRDYDVSRGDLYSTLSLVLADIKNLQPTKIIFEKPYIKLFGGVNTPPMALIGRIEVIQQVYQVLRWECVTRLRMQPTEASPNEYRGKFVALHKNELLEHARALFDPSLPNNILLSYLDASLLLSYLIHKK